MPDEFPPKLEQFIAQHIESLAQLEMLLLMRQDPERHWDCAEIARLLYIGGDMCAQLVKDLERHGIVRQVPESDGYQYHPRDAEMNRLVSDLASIYQERRVAVITQIYSRPMKKVQTFADAFRLRREDPT
jgi:hypothetical protein